ncbi:uncharacterized protein LOC126838769 [Adelges cooleyi]|uniref:uncharacterized protein LOC126838769 n=1 Tax=Adelges cooleyi TaxID=133065 RepID=UPI00217FF422|nr:uncharacterized protein LOC126838769 [Adelges cooleyi]
MSQSHNIMGFSELLAYYNKMYHITEELALKTLVDTEIPVYSSFIYLTSENCYDIIKNELDDWSNMNQPLPERMLLIYLLSDYISCGFSNPSLYATFNTTLKTNKSKRTLLKSLVSIWYYLFKALKITSLNIESIKRFVVVLERLFCKISKSLNDNWITIKFKEITELVEHYIKKYDQELKSIQAIQHSSGNNIHSENFKKRPMNNLDMNLSSNKSKIQKIDVRQIQKSDMQENKQNIKRITENVQPIFVHKQVVLLQNNMKPYLNEKVFIQKPQLNVFQAMMSNAKVQKNN